MIGAPVRLVKVVAADWKSRLKCDSECLNAAKTKSWTAIWTVNHYLPYRDMSYSTYTDNIYSLFLL